MSIMRCERHGSWDSDFQESCLLCEANMEEIMVTDEMVNRFLNWKLPQDFAPDCGISFEATYPGYLEDGTWVKNVRRGKHEWPVGTNLFSAEQARQMLEHVLKQK